MDYYAKKGIIACPTGGEIVIYQPNDGDIKLEVRIDEKHFSSKAEA